MDTALAVPYSLQSPARDRCTHTHQIETDYRRGPGTRWIFSSTACSYSRRHLTLRYTWRTLVWVNTKIYIDLRGSSDKRWTRSLSFKALIVNQSCVTAFFFSFYIQSLEMPNKGQHHKHIGTATAFFHKTLRKTPLNFHLPSLKRLAEKVQQSNAPRWMFSYDPTLTFKWTKLKKDISVAINTLMITIRRGNTLWVSQQLGFQVYWRPTQSNATTMLSAD